jgi:hypothetical protein
MMQSMYKSAVHLLDDLSAHSKLLHTPERAQVLLAAAQNPLLGEHHFAKALLPRLCGVILGAHKTTRHVRLRVRGCCLCVCVGGSLHLWLGLSPTCACHFLVCHPTWLVISSHLYHLLCVLISH